MGAFLHLVEQLRLVTTGRPEVAQHNPGFLVPMFRAPDGFETTHRSRHNIPAVRRRQWQLNTGMVTVTWLILRERRRSNEHLHQPAVLLLSSQLLRRPRSVLTYRLAH